MWTEDAHINAHLLLFDSFLRHTHTRMHLLDNIPLSYYEKQ